MTVHASVANHRPQQGNERLGANIGRCCCVGAQAARVIREFNSRRAARTATSIDTIGDFDKGLFRLGEMAVMGRFVWPKRMAIHGLRFGTTV